MNDETPNANPTTEPGGDSPRSGEAAGSMLHVDDFVQDMGLDDTPEMGDAKYARWLLMHWRLPASMKYGFARFIAGRELYCTYEGRRYRCIGGSRMGDVWLTSDFKRDTGYELRVDVAKCTAWSDTSNDQAQALRE